MYDYEGLDDKSFNKDFRRAAELNGLTWYPWVGANYASAKKKILFVAESHYSSENDPKLIAKKLAEVADDIDLTKDVAWESHVNNWWDNVMVRGLHQALFKTSRLPEDGRKSLWKTTAFYNFIQRPMEYNANNKERPSGEEFFAGWNTFVAVVKILKPEVVVFIGTTAMGCFRQALSAMHIKHEEVSCEFANGAYSRSGWLEVDNYRTSLLSIRHTSNFFSWPTWNEVLTRRIPGVVKFLNDIVFSSQMSRIIRKIRALLGKRDLFVSVKLLETDSIYAGRFDMHDWNGRYYYKTIEENKHAYDNKKKCAMSVIKKGTAYIVSAYSPVASALFDYENSDALDEYINKSPWKEQTWQQLRIKHLQPRLMAQAIH